MEYTALFVGARSQVRHLVSRDRIRYVDPEEGLDLDLTYITDRIIAMGYPSQDFIQSTYRNSIDDYSKFLRSKHAKKFRVYNLTENPYDGSKFEHMVLHFPINDHHSPSLETLLNILDSVNNWLSADEENVAAIHCKAGRGRTGTIISSFLLWGNAFESAEESMGFFAKRRSAKCEGVEVPSQARYVKYVEAILSKSVAPFPAKRVVLEKILMRPIPSFTLSGGCMPVAEIIDVKTNQVLYVTPNDQWKSYSATDFCAVLEPKVALCGDVLLRVYHQPSELAKSLLRTSFMFRASFHTSFVQTHWDLPKEQLDGETTGSLKDRRFPDDFAVRMIFSE